MDLLHLLYLLHLLGRLNLSDQYHPSDLEQLKQHLERLSDLLHQPHPSHLLNLVDPLGLEFLVHQLDQ